MRYRIRYRKALQLCMANHERLKNGMETAECVIKLRDKIIRNSVPVNSKLCIYCYKTER